MELTAKFRKIALWFSVTIAVAIVLIVVSWISSVNDFDEWLLERWRALVSTFYAQPVDLHAQYAEEERISQYIQRRDDQRDSFAYRDGLSLNLPLANGDMKTLTDNPCDCDGAISYEFIGYLPEIDSYLIELLPWEGEGYIIVSRKSGVETFIPAFPSISPDGRRVLVAYNCQESECYYDNSVLVLYSVNSELIEECYVDLDWLPSNPAWVDNRTIRLDRTEDTKDEAGQDSRAVRIQVVITRRGGTWDPPCKARISLEEKEKRTYARDDEESS